MTGIYPHWTKPQGDNQVMTESPQTQSEISIHQLVAGKPVKDGNIPAQCELLRCSLQEGMDILLWRGNFARPETLQLHDDLGRINFSCILEGTSHFAIQGLRRHTDWELARNRHYITHIVAASRALRSPSALKPSRCGCRILARSLRRRSTPTAAVSSSVVMLKPT